MDELKLRDAIDKLHRVKNRLFAGAWFTLSTDVHAIMDTLIGLLPGEPLEKLMPDKRILRNGERGLVEIDTWADGEYFLPTVQVPLMTTTEYLRFLEQLLEARSAIASLKPGS